MYVKKLNTGTTIPAIGFGTWQLAEGVEAREAVKNAIHSGYRLIDTAAIYGNEISVGDSVCNSGVSRGALFVTTKLGRGDLGYKTARLAFETSLHKLGVGYIDLYLIHWPGTDPRARKDSWRALGEIYKTGKAKAIGVSNYEISHLKEAASYSDIMPAVNQIEFHPYNYQQQKELLEYCNEHGIVVEAYSPLARGEILEEPVVKKISTSHRKSEAQVVLRWALQHNTVPIPKSGNPDRIKQNIDVFDFELNEREMELIDSIK